MFLSIPDKAPAPQEQARQPFWSRPHEPAAQVSHAGPRVRDGQTQRPVTGEHTCPGLHEGHAKTWETIISSLTTMR